MNKGPAYVVAGLVAVVLWLILTFLSGMRDYYGGHPQDEGPDQVKILVIIAIVVYVLLFMPVKRASK